MQQVATYESVARACERLKSEGHKVTGRAVLSITGGSLGTVLGYIKEWLASGEKGLAVVPSEIPSDLQTIILRSLGQAQAVAAAKLKEEIAQAGDRETEALEGLAASETRIKELATELEAIRCQAAGDRQTAEKAAAVSSAKVESLSGRVQELEIERRQLLDGAEASRIEAAKAMLQVERADQATAKAEARVKELEIQLDKAQQGKVIAEKAAAVAEQRSADQGEVLTETKAALVELKTESKATIAEQKNELQELRKAAVELEKQASGLRVEKADLEKSLARAEKKLTENR